MFERLVYRVGRGNVHCRFLDMHMTHEMGSEEKIVFVAFLQGSEMSRKVAKIAKNFKANVFEYCPGTVDADKRRVTAQLDQRTVTVNKTRAHIARELTNIVPKLAEWKNLAMREKAIYTTLNKFAQLAELRDGLGAQHSEFLTGEAWCPKCSIPAVNRTLQQAQHTARATAPSACRIFKSSSTPPTYYHVGKITYGFQAIVEAYGIARYRGLRISYKPVIIFLGQHHSLTLTLAACRAQSSPLRNHHVPVHVCGDVRRCRARSHPSDICAVHGKK